MPKCDVYWSAGQIRMTPKICDQGVRHLMSGQPYVFAFSSAVLFAWWTNVRKRQGKIFPVHAIEAHLHSF